MNKYKNFLAVVLLFGCIEIKLASACAESPWALKADLSCSHLTDDKTLEIYKDAMADNQSKIYCCAPDDPTLVQQRKKALSCVQSPCSTTATHAQNYCPTRHINGKASILEEILKEKCTTEGGQRGYTSFCCPKNSLEGQLASAFGAEPNEFPHMAKLWLPGHCGGTIYNKRFIITASHCVVNKKTNLANPSSNMKAIIGSNSGDNKDAKYEYKVEKVIPHPEYSRLKTNPNFETMKTYFLNDIALLKLERDIEFGPNANVKALQIAGKDFAPRAYADQAIIAGWGTTDTLAISVHLQKTNVLLRDPFNCFSRNKTTRKWGPHPHYDKFKQQLLCVGGVLEGKWSPVAGSGDSGGPAICRGPNGRAILCGVTSFGKDDKKCLENNDENNCHPSIYARVSHFHDWIKKEAGEPADDKHIYKPYLYGQPVSKGGRYDHQVHITSDTGKPCGGTLVREDVVVTAASCVAQDNGTAHDGVKVHYGLNELEKGKGTKPYDMVKFAIFEGFEMSGAKVNVSSQGQRVLITDNFYKNNLAAIKINGKVPISPDKLAELPGKGDMFENGKEIAFPRSAHRGGKLLSRDFHILDKDECQKRMTRLAKGEEKTIGGSTKIGEDILCGVEKYSGGSLCDRELGGGLICEGKNKKDVLCGVQIFRLCEWSLPNAFMDMSQKEWWVEAALKSFG